jgi:hypothetical protein
MSGNNNPPVTTRQRAAIIASLQGASPGPASFDDASLQLNQGQCGNRDSDREASTSNVTNPAFDQLTLIEAFSNIALQQRDQQRANQQLHHLVATLTEKVDDLSRRQEYDELRPEDNGENNSAPSHADDGEKVTEGDEREDEDDEEESSEEDEVGEQRFVDHTFYRHKIGEGFAQRQPSDLAPSKPAYFNIDDQVARTLGDSKFAAKRQEYTITVANAFFTAIANEAQKDALEAFEAGNHKTAYKLFKQVSNNLKAAADMQGDRMLFLNINSDPGATSKQKSFANDILRNEFTPGVTDRGGSASTRRKFELYEEQCLKATLGASAKAQANKHLAAGAYGGGGAGTVAEPKKRFKDGQPTKKQPTKRGAGEKAAGERPKPALKAEGSFLKNKTQPKNGKKAHFEAEQSDSD